MNRIAILTLVLVAGCGGGIMPTFDAGPDVDTGFDPMADAGPMYDAGADYDLGMKTWDAGTDADAGMPSDDAGDPPDAAAGPPPPVDAGPPPVCSSLADGCTGSFDFPGEADETVTTAAYPYFGTVGDFVESAPQVLPAVLVARHLDLANVDVVIAGGGSACGPAPEFRVLVNGAEGGRFTPAGFHTGIAYHFDFAPITGTVFTVRIEETTAWCAQQLRVTHDGL